MVRLHTPTSYVYMYGMINKTQMQTTTLTSKPSLESVAPPLDILPEWYMLVCCWVVFRDCFAFSGWIVFFA